MSPIRKLRSFNGAKLSYDQQIRSQVEADHKGEFLVVEVDTGDYEMDAKAVIALQRARTKHPDGTLYLMRIGYQAAYSLGGTLRFTTP